MKSAIFLTVAYLFATQFLLSQFGQCQSSSLTEEAMAILTEFPKVKKTTEPIAGNTIDQTIPDYSNQYRLALENSGYHLEFNAEKGITLTGATAADLIDEATCLTFNSPTINELTPNVQILVFINDQPTAIRANNVTAALRQIPAERIKAIDIRTDPLNNSDLKNEAEIIIRVTKIK